MQWLNVEDSVYWDVILWWLINILPMFCSRRVSLKHQKLFYLLTLKNTPEDLNLQHHHCENLKPHMNKFNFLTFWVNYIYRSAWKFWVQLKKNDWFTLWQWRLKREFFLLGFLGWLFLFVCLFVSSCFRATSHYQSNTTI